MRKASVADGPGRADRARDRALDPAERIARALTLGRRDLASYAATAGVSATAARRAVERRRQARRRPSAALTALLG
jgi:hypothetical protein